MERLTNHENEDNVNEVTSVSPFVNLQYFDNVDGFVSDFMHCCLSRAWKHVIKLILIQYICGSRVIFKVNVTFQSALLNRKVNTVARQHGRLKS